MSFSDHQNKNPEKIDTETLNQWDHQYLWHPFTQMENWGAEPSLFIERGEGVWLFDTEGNRYLDGVSSLWCNVHGHNRSEINRAIQNQLEKVAHSTLLGLGNVPATLLAKKLVDISPASLNRVFYSDNGSTAVEIALKMAYQYWQQKENPVPTKKKFVRIREAYHGDTLGSVSVGGMDLFHSIFEPLLFDCYDIPSPFLYGSSFELEEHCRDKSLRLLSELLENQHREIIGLITESYVQGASGMVVFPSGFMRELARLCREYEILLIVDEVATGFGRTGRMFALEEDGLEPDFMILAKGITGGYLPLAATLTTEEVYSAFLGSNEKTFFHGHTYTGNPLASASALASLEIFYKDQTLFHLEKKIDFLRDRLKDFRILKGVQDIRQKGMMVGIQLGLDHRKPYPQSDRMGHSVSMRARDYGVIIRPLGDVLVCMPPLSIEIEEIKLLCDAVYRSIEEVIKVIK